MRDVRDRYPPDLNSSHALAHVLRTGRALVVPTVTDDWLQANTRAADHLQVMRAIGLRSYMCVPSWRVDVSSARSPCSLHRHSAAMGRTTRPWPKIWPAGPRWQWITPVCIKTPRRRAPPAEAALRLRDEFLSVASHDLRAPLTNILGRTDLLEMRLGGATPLDPVWGRTQLAALGTLSGDACHRAGDYRCGAVTERATTDPVHGAGRRGRTGTRRCR